MERFHGCEKPDYRNGMLDTARLAEQLQERIDE